MPLLCFTSLLKPQMADSLRSNTFPYPSMRSFPAHFTFAFNYITGYNFYILQARPMRTSFPHAIFAFVIPNLLDLLILKFQNQDKSPFETHPKTVSFGVLCVLLYCLAYDLHQRLSLPRLSPMLACLVHHCALFFGYMTIASLVSLLLPDSASPAIYVGHVALAVGCPLLHLVYQRIRGLFRGARFQNRPNLPILTGPGRNANQRYIFPV